MFSPALSCLGFRCSWLGLRPTLPRKSKNLPRTKPRIQEPAEDKAEKKIRTDAYRKNQISKLRSSKLLSLSQTSLFQHRWAAVLPPGGLQSNPNPYPPPNSGRRVGQEHPGLLVLPSPSPWTKFLTQRFWEPGLLSSPSLVLPHWARADSIFCGDLRRWRVLAPLGPKKSRSKRPSKTDQILRPCQHRFLSVLAPFWRAKMAPKSIRNRSKLSFQAFLFPHRF